jgi:hypothetical protein
MQSRRRDYLGQPLKVSTPFPPSGKSPHLNDFEIDEKAIHSKVQDPNSRRCRSTILHKWSSETSRNSKRYDLRRAQAHFLRF